MNIWQRHGPVIFRGSLYFIAALSAPFIEKAVPILLHNKWPTAPTWTACWILGGAAGVIALRAYYDGSAERRGQELKEQNGNGSARKFNMGAVQGTVPPDQINPQPETSNKP